MKATTFEEGREMAPKSVSGGSTRQFWFLLKQDAARRSLKWSIPIALLIGLLLRSLAGADVHDWDRLPFYKHHGELSYALVELWLALLFAVIIAHFNSRCSSMSLGLPISPRRLWLVRIASIAAAGVLPMVTIVLSVSLFSRGNIIEPALVKIGARIAAGIVLSVVLFQIPDPGLYRIQGTKRFKWYVAAVTVCVLFYVMVTPESWLYTLLPLIVAAVVVSVVYGRMPRSFRTAETGRSGPAPKSGPPKESENHAAVQWRVSSRTGRSWRMIRLILRETVNSWQGWFMILLITVSVWSFLAQYYAAFYPLGDYVILMLWIWILLMQSMKGLSRLDSYPIPRGLVFGVLVVVIAIAMGAGFTLGYVIHHNSEPITQVRGQDGQIRVPFEAWEIAWDGRPPEVKAPWGESYTPEGRCFFKSGSEACAYNPFEIAKDTSSPEFVVYQIDRAVERVHGTDPAAPKMSDAVLDSSFVKQFEGKKYTVAGSLYRDSGLRSRTQAVVLTGWEILFALLVGVWWRRFGPGADMNRTRWFAILFFTMPYVILFTLEILDARGVVSTRAALAFTMIGLRSIAQAIPLGTGMLWAIPAFVGLASLWYVRRCYVKAEAPLRCGEKSLLSEY